MKCYSPSSHFLFKNNSVFVVTSQNPPNSVMASTATQCTSTITVQTPSINTFDSIVQHVPAEEFADLYQFLQETLHDVENDPCLSLDYMDADLSLMREPLPNPEEEENQEHIVTVTQCENTITVQTPSINTVDTILQHIPAKESADLYQFLRETLHDVDSTEHGDLHPEERKQECIVSPTSTTQTPTQTQTHTPTQITNHNKPQKSKNKNYERFHEYIKRYYPWSTINGCNQANPLNDEECEDLCFICKDGGDLVLCDFPGCKKVYDRRLFQEDDDLLTSVQKWICPRHYCTGCNCTESEVKYICMLCPFSSCKGCVSKYESRNGWTIVAPNTLNPHDIALNESLQDVTWIACHHCTRELDKLVNRRANDSRRYMTRYSYLEKLDMSRRINICVEGAKPPLMKRQRLY